MSGPRAAAFLDRDGTIIVEKEYLADPDGVELIPGAAEALRSLQDAGYLIVLVTNQSGIARGYYGETQYRAVQERLVRCLADHGVDVHASYHCPHHPDITGPCGCRKPAPGLFERAAAEHGIDLTASLYIGDRISDVQPGLRRGGTCALVRTGYGRVQPSGILPDTDIHDDVRAAVRALLGSAEAVDTPPDHA